MEYQTKHIMSGLKSKKDAEVKKEMIRETNINRMMVQKQHKQAYVYKTNTDKIKELQEKKVVR